MTSDGALSGQAQVPAFRVGDVRLLSLKEPVVSLVAEAMEMRVLVGYATAHGSTQGVAERIAQGLRQVAITADVLPMAEVADLNRYDAVVLGSAIHGGNWLPDGQQFIERQSGVLRSRPVWLFSVSTLGDEESMFRPRAAERLRRMRKETPELARFRESIGPREHRNFAGVIRRSDWPATGRAFFRAMGGHYGDHRNWAAIDAWTEQIVRALADSPMPVGTAGQPGQAANCL